MFLRTRNFGIAAPLLVAAGAMFGFGSQAMGSTGGDVDVNFGIWIGHRTPAPAHHDDCYAGTLTIDGRCFVIETHRSVRHQILHAFQCMGYDAWYVGRSVRVRTSDCREPEVCWRNGEYRMLFRERHTSITLTPDEICDGHGYGSHYRYGYDRAHGRYYSFSGVQGVGGSVSWSSLGVSAFVDNDNDLDDEVRGPERSNDRRVDRDDSGRRIDDAWRRSSTPGQKNVDGDRADVGRRNRIEAKPAQPAVKAPVGVKAPEVKRTQPPSNRDEVKTLPADRLDLKRTAKPAAPPAQAPTAKKGDAKAKSPTPPQTKQSKPATKQGDDKKSKW